MGIRIRDAGGTLRTAVRVRMRDTSGTLRTIQRIRVRDASNVLRTVWQYFTAGAAPATATKTSSGAAISGSVTSNTYTCTVTGGTGPFTYSWEYVSGETTISANSSGSATTTFTDPAVFDGFASTAIFDCAVTDTSTGDTTRSNAVQITLRWIDTT